LGRRDDAIAAYRKAYSINPQYDKAYLEAARLLQAKNDTSGAITAYQQVIRIDAANTSALRELGNVYASAGRYREAEEQFRKALAFSSEDALTNYNLSTALYNQDKLKDSLTYAQKAYNGAKKDSTMDAKNKVSIIYNYALLLDESGKVDDSISVYQEALKLDGRHVRSLINLGNIFLESGDGASALTFLMKAVALDPSNFEANNNMGKAYLQQKDYRTAVDYFQTALKLDSSNNDVRANLARAYASAEDYENAKIVYTDVIRADNKNWDAYIELGKVCISLHDSENAEKYLVYVQEKNPGYRSSEIVTLLSSL
jgi:tetratricopeptide (TPR) repeat protein